MIYDKNRLYSRAIHCPGSMEMHYVQWFLLKGVYEITVCEKKLDFAFLSLGGPSYGARVSFLGYITTESFGGLYNKFLCFGTWPIHQTRAPCPLLLATALYFLTMVPMLWHSAETPNPGTMAWSAHGLVRPDSRRQNFIFFTNSNILHTLKKEPLNIMLLHTSRTMDGP